MLDHIIALASDPNWLDAWEAGNWLKGMIEPYVWRLGRATFVLLLGAPLTLGLWIQTESLVMPGVILALFMGLMLSGAPPAATIVGYVIVTLAVAIAYKSITGVGTR